MPFAVELFLDPVSTAVVRGIWHDLSRVGAPPVEGAVPHVTLGVCERLAVDRLEEALRDFAAAEHPVPVSFASVGIFASELAVVFLAPVVTADLLAVHERFHRRFDAFAAVPSAHYLPDRWVPHCTIAERCPMDLLPRLVASVVRIPLPIQAHLESVGLVEFTPLVQHYAFAFSAT